MNKLLMLCSLALILACGNTNQQRPTVEKAKINQVDLKSELDQLESDLKNSKSTKIDKTKANLLIDKSIAYVDAFPSAKESTGYLFRAAEVCVGIKNFDRAISLFERVKKEYFNHEKAPIAVFLQGFTCENSKKDIKNAKRYYNEFLAKHPNHELVEQVKALLANIDVSPEDLIKSFQEKRKSDK